MPTDLVELETVESVLRAYADEEEHSAIDEIMAELREEAENGVIQSVASHRDQLEGAIESAVNDIRILAPRLEEEDEEFARQIGHDLENTVENPPGDAA